MESNRSPQTPVTNALWNQRLLVPTVLSTRSVSTLSTEVIHFTPCTWIRLPRSQAPRGRRGLGGLCTYRGSAPKRLRPRPIFSAAAKVTRLCKLHFPSRPLSARQSCLRPMMNFLRRYSGCCGPCQPIRYSAKAERGFSRCTRTTWRQRSYKFCGRTKNHILSTNWPGRAFTPTKSCCEPLLVSQDCGRC